MRLVTPRTAGLLYLVVIVLGLFSEAVVRGRLTTAAGILASQGLYRAGIVANLAYLLAETVLVVVLLRLLAPVDRDVSLLAAAFRFAGVVVQATNLVLMFAALLAARDGTGRVPFFLDLFRYGYGIALAFFAACCAATGHLLRRAERVSRALGWMLYVAGLAYLANSLWLFTAGFDGTVTALLVLPAAVAEVWLTVMLLRRGDTPFAGTGKLDNLLVSRTAH